MAIAALSNDAFQTVSAGCTLMVMADFSLPRHVVTERRDGRREIVLHRSMAVISPERIEIKAARSTVVLPVIGLALAGAAIYWMAVVGGLPFWALVAMLLFCMAVVPLSVMSLISSIAGADVIIDAKKQSATWQQGYLGMGIGTKELVPFWKIANIEVTIEGDQPDRWRDQPDSLRQFALVLVKESGKRLTLAQVPVPAGDQEDGMDRILAVGQAIGGLTEKPVALPEGWELIEVDDETLEPVATPAEPKKRGSRGRGS